MSDGFVDVELPSDADALATIGGITDPVLVGPGKESWSTRTPDGPGTAVFERVEATVMRVHVHGPGSDWLADAAHRLWGALDDLSGFEPPPGRLRDVWLRQPFRFGRSDRVWEAMVGAVLSQRVRSLDAAGSVKGLKYRYGEPAPGPVRTNVLPGPETVARLGYAELHPLGVERSRAETLIKVAREFARIDEATITDAAALERRFGSLRGIGPWTLATVASTALGDPDAVPVGDVHLPNHVSWWVAREPRATDERMLELLEPWRGHRGRVIRLAVMAGPAPKRGPRFSPQQSGLHRGR